MSSTHKHSFACVVLAAGKGTRMKSALPKVLHPIAGKPMIAHVLGAAASLQPDRIALVIAPGMENVQKAALAYYPGSAFAQQSEQKGTGHAVRCGLEAIADHRGTVLVLYGDTPLIRPESLACLLENMQARKTAIALLGMRLADPTGYGRLVMAQEPFVEHIVECKDASAGQKNIPWVWGGVMAFDGAFLREGLAALEPSPVTGEYYLTALIGMATARGLKTLMCPMPEEEAMGINDRAQLAQAEAALQHRLRLRAMQEGATLVAPETVFLSTDTRLARDVVVQPHVIFGANVSVGEGAHIRSFSHIEGARIDAGAVIGPFARIRPGSVIEEGAHVGNFVELKQTRLARGAKANHLSYVGDADVGEEANIGAGTITCNYDGYAKHKTIIGAGAFIGSNSSLVAPVMVGAGAIVGAGSVVTENVAAGALAVARAAQVTVVDKARQIKAKKAKK